MIPIPVYLYDVCMGSAPGADDARVIATCRTEIEQTELVNVLRGWCLSGKLVDKVDCWAAQKRTAWVEMELEPGSTVTVRGFSVSSETVAAILLEAAPKPPAPAPEPSAAEEVLP